jgi:transcription initiation factor TFIID subunit 2
MLKNILNVDFKLFMAYTREGTLDTLRATAFDCLIDLGALRNRALANYICFIMGRDPSPFVRRRVQVAFGRGLGIIAMSEQQNSSPGINGAVVPSGETILEDIGVDNGDIEVGGRKDAIAQDTVAGAIETLKARLRDDENMKSALWNATMFVFL